MKFAGLVLISLMSIFTIPDGAGDSQSLTGWGGVGDSKTLGPLGAGDSFDVKIRGAGDS